MLKHALMVMLAAAPLAVAQPHTEPARAVDLRSPVVDVPLTKVGDFYFVDVFVNDKPLRFTIETGANFFAIGSRAAKAIGLPVDTVTLTGPMPGPTEIARIATLRFGGVTLNDLRARVLPLFDGGSFTGDGIISLVALRQVLATLDFPNKRLRVERGELPEPNGRDILAMNGRDRGGRVDIPVDIGGVSLTAVLDTRSYIPLVVPDSLDSILRVAAPPVSAGEAMGPTLGTFQMRGARAASDMRIGTVQVTTPPVVFRNRPGVVLGIPLLEQLAITLDQRNRRVRISHPTGGTIAFAPQQWETRTTTASTNAGPAPRVQGPAPVSPGDRTMGFNVAGTPGGALTIRNVVPGSSAAQVGLREGDDLVEFDGTSAASMSPTIFRAAAARGEPIKVVVTREGKRVEVMVRPYTVPQSNDIGRLLALDSLWARNYATNDTASAGRLMSDDFFMLSANGTTKDKKAELGDVGPAPGLQMRYFRTSDVRVRPHASVALITGVAEWAFEQSGTTRTVRRGYTAAYVRGGPLGWQLAALQMRAPDPAPPSAPAEVREGISQLHSSMIAALKRSPAEVAQFYSDDAHVAGGGFRAVGREQVDRYWSGSGGLSDWSLTVLEVAGDASYPFVLGRSVVTGQGGRLMTTEYVAVLRREADGRLRFHRDLYAAVR